MWHEGNESARDDSRVGDCAAGLLGFPVPGNYRGDLLVP